MKSFCVRLENDELFVYVGELNIVFMVYEQG